MQKRDNSGVLFKNTRKEADNHADYQGDALIGGVPHWLNAWIREDKNGHKFFGLSFKPKNEAKRTQNVDIDF